MATAVVFLTDQYVESKGSLVRMVFGMLVVKSSSFNKSTL
jgi:hypothetical protein